MVTKDLQTLNLKFDQLMFDNLGLTWERNFEVTFGIFSVLVFQISVLESYLGIYLFLKIKNVKIVINYDVRDRSAIMICEVKFGDRILPVYSPLNIKVK